MAVTGPTAPPRNMESPLFRAWLESLTTQLHYEYGTWTPTITASESMTVSSTSIKVAQYVSVPILKLCFINLQVDTTLGGTASWGVYATLPVASDATDQQYLCVLSFQNSGAREPTAWIVEPASSTSWFQPTTDTNWTLGAITINAVAMYRTG